MHIHDFYSKLTSGTEGGSLFQVLRNMRSMEDVRAVLDGIDIDWPAWDTGGPAVSCVAVQA
jgi:hypothetical protein